MAGHRVAVTLPLAVGERRVLRGLTEQQAFGAAWTALAPGAVLFLEGELGAGKTSFSQGLVAALGFDGAVTSPTYALMNLYPTPAGPVLHVDAYRVRDVAELYEMDLDEQVQSSRLSLIEWGEGLYADYPDAPVLRLDHMNDPETRQVTRIR
ncbi:tRNA (adenosine(37)-N6)-threonylcarbamoyltransferase complex ATPase subunit type 1 TsaE [Deinococcus aquaedulcis]|uniref:tRNA (adenosine(37)-N6)-threonylcarbamoyltransferase complex ATPase subunit type 1 TsaE n=1 Tax=Deinococcus aquaedulcis TaxID=2840455 RepID=UPI002E2D04FC|nr:tRNA (adenosine(37)-N6)-threonylcarbamoyltransferase complex ATPase subunit type 1 TsaE [Deinococcus aquaedulcis]